MDNPAIAASWSLVQRSEYVFLSSLDERDGSPDTRVVFNLRKARAEAFRDGAARLPDGFETWIATNTSSRKVRELHADKRGCLYFADTAAIEGLTLQGAFEEVLDNSIRRALWVDGWNMFYPGGLEGGDFSLFRFRPERARYYHGLNVENFDPRLSL